MKAIELEKTTSMKRICALFISMKLKLSN